MLERRLTNSSFLSTGVNEGFWNCLYKKLKAMFKTRERRRNFISLKLREQNINEVPGLTYSRQKGLFA